MTQMSLISPTEPPRSATFAYNPALDGVRAVAVGAVMVYHGFVGWLPGGFLGVDLFFVLSGYLITTLLLLERSGTGRIALGAFWSRRAKRLLPALFLVLLWVAAYIAFFADKAMQDQLRGDGLATLFYVANWHFIFGDQSYFDQFSDPSPLRHMWSLAIEEQWYVLWPLFVAGGLALRIRTRTWLVVLGALTLLSTIAMQALAAGTVDTSRAYYGTDTRAQSLLVGAILAFALAKDSSVFSRFAARRRVATALGCLGLTGFIVFITLVDDQSRWMYSGGFLLAALVSAALIVGVTCGPQDTPLRRILGTRPLAAVGRVSYGLYLWHWPVYVFLTPERTGIDTRWPLLMLRIAVSTAVAVCSYFLFEQRFRTLSLAPRRLAAGMAGMAGVVALTLVASTPDPGSTAAYSPNAIRQTGVPSALIVGDSVYFDLVYRLGPEEHPGVNIRSGAFVGCGLLPAPQWVTLTDACENRFENWDIALEGYDPEVIVMGLSIWDLVDVERGSRTITFGSNEFRDYASGELDDLIERLDRGRGAEIWFVNLPCREPDQVGVRLQNLSQSELAERTQWLNGFLEDFVSETQHRNLRILDLDAKLCVDGQFRPGFEGETLYRDGIHFRRESDHVFWDWLLPQLANVQVNEEAKVATPDPAAQPVDPPVEKVLVMGDSVYLELVVAHNQNSMQTGLEVSTGAILGCGLMGPPADFETQRCQERYVRWSEAFAATEADRVLIGLSPWDLVDRAGFGGTAIGFGSDTYRQMLANDATYLLDLARREGAQEVTLLEIGCIQPAEGLRPLSLLSAEELEKRRTWFNSWINTFVENSTYPNVSVEAPLDSDCSQGYNAEVNGVVLHRDGVHYTPEGAASFWRWVGEGLGFQ